MKKTLTILLIITASLGFAQKKTITKSKLDVGNLHCANELSIDYDKEDTIEYIYVSFKNEKYTYASDRKSIILYKDEYVQALIKDLTFGLSEMSTGSNMDWTRKEYHLSVYDFSNYIYLTDKNLLGYVKLDKRTTVKLIDWLTELK